jgi:hypothetical protein
MKTTLTREVRDRSVAALRRAHAEGTKKANGQPVDEAGGVCSCVVIAREFGVLPELRSQWADPSWRKLYDAVLSLGYPATGAAEAPVPLIARINDHRPRPFVYRTFDEVADVIERWDVVDEAEQICRDAASVPA